MEKFSYLSQGARIWSYLMLKQIPLGVGVCLQIQFKGWLSALKIKSLGSHYL